MDKLDKMTKKFSSKYGYFTQDGNEYVITRPDPPKPWVNVISNGDSGLIVSQAGGGFSWRTHSNFNRITRWNQDLVQDNWGKFIYLKDLDSNEVWSAAYQPVKNPAARYECHHGQGYSTLCAEFNGIQSDWTLFIAQEEPVEIWLLTLTNTGQNQRQIGLFTYLEWCLGFAPDNHREFHKTFISTRFDPDQNALFANKVLWEVADEKGRHWNRDWPYTAFQSVSAPIKDFDGDKEDFLGILGDLSAPAALKKGCCNKTEGQWGDAVSVLHLELDLAPGETRTLAFTLGAVESPEKARSLIQKYRPVSAARAELEKVKSFWQQLLAANQVQTPDDAFDFMTNTWLKYQAISCRLWGRAAYYQQSGAFGFRDQLQDSQVFLPLKPELTRSQILLHAAHQFKDGSVYHWWHPMTETGHHTQVSDNLLWLPFVCSEYIKETGSFDILTEAIGFVDDSHPVPLWQHCKLALQRALSWRSPRGLLLIGAHDWNDGLNAVGNDMAGESIWLSHFVYKILQTFYPIAVRIGKAQEFDFCPTEAEKIRAAIETHAWDGDWFWRATRDNGEKIGSHTNTEGKIYLNAQTWAVIAGTTSENRAHQAMAAVEKFLDRDYGPLLLWPAYAKPDPTIGYITRYAPGRRENGGLYTHAGTWAIWAETILKRSEKAFAMYHKFNPIYRGMAPDLYQVEPYVTPGNVEGPDSPLYGRGGWTWYTGSAAWLYKISLEGILGLQPTLDGLVLDPCIPPDWPGFSARRVFRGAVLEIEVKNPGGPGFGVAEITIDGKPYQPQHIDGKPVLPIFPAGSSHRVQVLLKPKKESR